MEVLIVGAENLCLSRMDQAAEVSAEIIKPAIVVKWYYHLPIRCEASQVLQWLALENTHPSR